jgi:hypothetical protein
MRHGCLVGQAATGRRAGAGLGACRDWLDHGRRCRRRLGCCARD